MIISGPPADLPCEFAATLKRKGWQTLRPGQIYALFWDSVLQVDSSDAEKLMQRVLEIHKLATQYKINHMFKTVKTTEMSAGYQEI